MPEIEQINACIDKGFLISPDFARQGSIPITDMQDIAVMNDDIYSLICENITDVNWVELDRLRVMYEKKGTKKPYDSVLSLLRQTGKKEQPKIELEKKDFRVVFSYNDEILKKSVDNFVCYFNARFREIEGMLSQRQELSLLTSVSRLSGKNDRDSISIIAIISDIEVTAKNNIILKVEDTTGKISVLVSKSKPELYEMAKDLVVDEIIGITGVCGDNIIFCNNITLPDIPLTREFKKSNEECHAIFLSDIHVGSTYFMEKEFESFLSWLQSDAAAKVKYVFIAGDLVDGVGIYPGQEEELTIKDIYEQYAKCAEYLTRIPKHMNIIVCPGNHDATRLSEPQPPLIKDMTKPLTDIPNLTMLSNPCIVNILSADGFPGFDVMLYHGYSFDYFIANVESIRNGGGYDRADLIMKFLLQRRHLAPSHKATLYVPDKSVDPLVIRLIPDFFVSGHIHKVAVSQYRGVSLICGSCWQSKTKFQEKMGHHPEPARVPIVNLRTRETKILRFDDEACK